MTKQKKVALILAGGKGTRLWPLSRENYPKQFVEFEDGKSLFQLSVERSLSYFSPSEIYIVSSQKYKFILQNQIDFLCDLSAKKRKTLKENLIFEPVAKNTAPAIMLSLKYLEQQKKYKDDLTVYVFPSDHLIKPVSRFKKSLVKAGKLADKGLILTFGVVPQYPKEGYGYIVPQGTGNRIKKFIEKPDFKKAQQLLKKGAFWNSGIFCFKKRLFLEELKKHKPAMYKYYRYPLNKFMKAFSKVPFDSIDYAVMQKTKKAGVIKFNCRWSDLGSWDSLLDFYSQEKNKPAGDNVCFLESQNCFVQAHNHKLVSLIGLKDVIAIDTPDALLLAKKGESDKVKKLITILNKKKSPHVKDSLTVYRPWGYYTVLKEKENYKVKEIGVFPKKYISLQRHKYRSEHWNVVEGKAEIIIGKKRIAFVHKNESVYVPKKKKHKVYNPANKVLRMIEVQIGSNLVEEDIERFDSY